MTCGGFTAFRIPTSIGEILDATALIEESEEDGDLDEINGDDLERDDEGGN